MSANVARPRRHAVHLALVSEQAVPNVTPALDPAFRPDTVLLLVSPAMAERAASLARVLGDAGVRVERHPVDDPWDVAGIRDAVFDILAAREHEDIALNATGGTKPMAIAATYVFRTFGRPIFYVHPHLDRVVWIDPPGLEPIDLANRIRLPAFLRAHGAEPELPLNVQGVDAALRALGEELVANVASFERALAVLNWLASQAEGTLASGAVPADAMRNPHFARLLDLFAERGLVSVRDGRLRFPNEKARFFANGGWLEDYTFGVLFGLRARQRSIQDAARSVRIARTWGGSSVPNELDVMFLAENRLYLVECKTRRFGREPDPEGPGAEVLYKLDTLKDLLGGLNARAMLVSYRTLRDFDLRRAGDLGVEVCHGPSLHSLESRLERWIR